MSCFESGLMPTCVFFPIKPSSDDCPATQHSNMGYGAHDNCCETVTQVGARVFWGLTLAVAIIGSALLAAAFIISTLTSGGSHLPESMSSFATCFIKDGAMTTAGIGTVVAASVSATPIAISFLGNGVVDVLRQMPLGGPASA